MLIFGSISKHNEKAELEKGCEKSCVDVVSCFRDYLAKALL